MIQKSFQISYMMGTRAKFKTNQGHASETSANKITRAMILYLLILKAFIDHG